MLRRLHQHMLDVGRLIRGAYAGMSANSKREMKQSEIAHKIMLWLKWQKKQTTQQQTK